MDVLVRFYIVLKKDFFFNYYNLLQYIYLFKSGEEDGNLSWKIINTNNKEFVIKHLIQ